MRTFFSSFILLLLAISFLACNPDQPTNTTTSSNTDTTNDITEESSIDTNSMAGIEDDTSTLIAENIEPDTSDDEDELPVEEKKRQTDNEPVTKPAPKPPKPKPTPKPAPKPQPIKDDSWTKANNDHSSSHTDDVQAPPKPAPKPEPAPPSPKPVVSFETLKMNFGTINEGDKLKKTFYFSNNGDADLVIKDATASCGCTVPAYPIIPVAPGEGSAVTVNFNSRGKFGPQKAEIKIVTNADPAIYRLILEGEVVKSLTEEEEPGPEHKNGE